MSSLDIEERRFSLSSGRVSGEVIRHDLFNRYELISSGNVKKKCVQLGWRTPKGPRIFSLQVSRSICLHDSPMELMHVEILIGSGYKVPTIAELVPSQNTIYVAW